MMPSMLKAYFWGITILIILNGVWILALQTEVVSAVSLLAEQISPFVAAVVSAYLAPRKNVIVGSSMALPATFIVVAVTSIYQLFGKPVDFPGVRGGVILFVITLLYCLFLCWLGGLLGYFIVKRKHMKNDM